ncbi:hypothetical protein WICPIJ_002417 [Wickerhamomyces pijperi]|uniref:Prefoldin subunit 5 n=1 Tax=Wickerhamomyces pijperi TaxID=599730 RepID=A0A9P8Q975_WICPI|nr:hypothetical protein WICPIJ_002417 [Wickerhamomyces pijperi]
MTDQRKIDITQLDPQQLSQLQSQFESELTHFQTSLQALQVASVRYKECISNITQLQVPSTNTEILVPLSSSLYVPGKIKNNDLYLVDIGTGYYVEKSSKDAVKFYEGKVKQLELDHSKLVGIVNEKQSTLQRVRLVLREKVMLLQQQQQQQKQGVKA